MIQDLAAYDFEVSSSQLTALIYSPKYANIDAIYCQYLDFCLNRPAIDISDEAVPVDNPKNKLSPSSTTHAPSCESFDQFSFHSLEGGQNLTVLEQVQNRLLLINSRDIQARPPHIILNKRIQSLANQDLKQFAVMVRFGMVSHFPPCNNMKSRFSVLISRLEIRIYKEFIKPANMATAVGVFLTKVVPWWTGEVREERWRARVVTDVDVAA